MIISFNGKPGSGKSTIAKMLAEKLSWPHYYMGGLRRQKARERGMTLPEYNKLGETDPSTDMEVDEYQKKLGETEDKFIIEGRTSWHFIPHSLKIFFDVDDKVGAKRILNELGKSDDRNEGGNIKTLYDALKLYSERMKSDDLRYKKYFGIDVFDKNHFDFVLDTSDLTRYEVFKKVMEFVENKLQLKK
jgi:CMP/dCMP kinase